MENKTPDLIDRAALVQEVNRDIDRCYALGIGAVGPLSNFLDQIQRQPTVDTVEVVHCKDCEWFRLSDGTRTGIGQCLTLSGMARAVILRNELEYCSRARMKTE